MSVRLNLAAICGFVVRSIALQIGRLLWDGQKSVGVAKAASLQLCDPPD
jgi:hypothetical protein